MTKMLKIMLSGAIALGATLAYSGPNVEVLHWWTSGGEAKALDNMKQRLDKKGVAWQDMPIAGGSGTNARQVLRARVLAKNPPSSAQMKAAGIMDWMEAGDDIFSKRVHEQAVIENWDSVLPDVVAKGLKCDGYYCAAPVNVHRVDWLWSNPQVLAKVGATVPTTWAEFNAVADKLKSAGITPLAHGGQAWQDATVFEVVAISLGGPKFYENAFVKLDNRAIQSETMVNVFKQFRKLRGYVDRSFQGRDWNLATSMVINGEAGFQIMGDWAKGEFLIAGKVPGVDFNCSTIGNGYLYNVDSFAFFNLDDDADAVTGQKQMASVIMDTDFQKAFNLAKGSIPARTDVSLADFDNCAVKSQDDMISTGNSGGLQPSYAHGMALQGAFSGAVTDVVTNFFNSDQSAEDAVRALVAAIDAER